MVASYSSLRLAMIGLAATTALLGLAGVSRPPDLGAQAAVQSLGIFAAAWTVGRLIRARRAALLALVAEAEQRAAVERELAAAERDRTMLTQVEERLRIARDVHDVLAHSISVVALLSPKITRRLIDHYTQQAQPSPGDLERIGQLTPRETELLLSVARGLTNAEISAQHHISVSTTKTHVGNLLTKLAARDRVQLTITAYEAGLMAYLRRPRSRMRGDRRPFSGEHDQRSA